MDEPTGLSAVQIWWLPKYSREPNRYVPIFDDAYSVDPLNLLFRQPLKPRLSAFRLRGKSSSRPFKENVIVLLTYRFPGEDQTE